MQKDARVCKMYVFEEKQRQEETISQAFDIACYQSFEKYHILYTKARISYAIF